MLETFVDCDYTNEYSGMELSEHSVVAVVAEETAVSTGANESQPASQEALLVQVKIKSWNF